MLQCYWDTPKCNTCNSRDPGVPQLGENWLVSRFMKGIFHLRPPQPKYTKTWDVSKVLSYLKSLGPNDTQFEATNIENSSLVDNLSWTTNSCTTMFSVTYMDQSLDKVIFHVIGLIKCSKPTRPN